MKKIKVHDLPTRVFHWLFGALFLAAFIIAKTVDDDSSAFSYHIFAGLTVAFILILRIVWGFAGTAYARFSSFKLRPLELATYFKDLLVAKTRRYLSHNPASSYAALIMFVCAAGLVATGITMTSGNQTDFAEEAHEIFANVFFITVIAHVIGVLFHRYKHKDSLWFSMVDGKKEEVPGEKGISSTKPVAGVLFVVFVFSWIIYLNTQYDRSNQTLNLFGTELAIGEEEH